MDTEQIVHLPMPLEQQIDEIRSLSGYHLIARLRELASRAAGGDAASMQLLAAMLKDCEKLETWKEHSRYASGVIHAVGQIRSMKAMQLLLGLTRSLPEATPAGALELIASILPEFRRFVMGPIREFVERRDNSPAFLVGVQTLCNLYIEGHLEGSDIDYLADALEGLQTGDYLTQHIVELVYAEIKQHRDSDHAQLDALLGELVS